MSLRKTLARAAYILTAIVLVYGLLLILITLSAPATNMDEWFRPKPSKPFSKPAWQSTRFADPDRYKMANYLVSSGRLLGLPQAEVRTLLGQPSFEGGSTLEPRLKYDLVRQRQFPARSVLLPGFLFRNTDTWMLEIECAAGKVKSVKIRST